MRKKLSVRSALAIVFFALIGIGLLGWKLATLSTPVSEVVVKVAHPDDPKYRPDPKLGVPTGAGLPKGSTTE